MKHFTAKLIIKQTNLKYVKFISNLRLTKSKLKSFIVLKKMLLLKILSLIKISLVDKNHKIKIKYML